MFILPGIALVLLAGIALVASPSGVAAHVPHATTASNIDLGAVTNQ